MAKFFAVFLSVWLSLFVNLSFSCNWEGVNQCIIKNQNGHCFFNKKLIACLKTFSEYCEYPETIYVSRELRIHRDQIAACPDLADGNCWEDLARNCTANLPSFIFGALNGIDLSKTQLDKTSCQNLKMEAVHTKACLNNFVNFCSKSDLSKREAASYLPIIDGGIEACNSKGF